VDAVGCEALSAPSVVGLSGALVDAAFFGAAFGEVTGRSLINFVLPFSPSVPAVVWPPGSVAVFAYPGFEPALKGDFLAPGIHGIQCLYQAAPIMVTTNAIDSSTSRSAPARKPGVKFPLARFDRLDLGNDLLKSSEGMGRSSCSAAVNCGGARS